MSGQERLLLQCSVCQKTYASKASITKHLQLLHGKTKEPSTKEKQELIKKQDNNLKKKKF